MARQPRQGGSNVFPLDGDGVSVIAPSGAAGYTLIAGHTYFFEVGGGPATFEHVQLKWDAAIAITTAVLEETDFGNDVTSIDTTLGNWIAQDPAGGYVAKNGGTLANSTISVVAGTAGGATWNLPASGARRRRLKVVVGATGGVVRVGTNGKD